MDWRETPATRVTRWIVVLTVVGTAHAAGAAYSLLARGEPEEDPEGVFVVFDTDDGSIMATVRWSEWFEVRGAGEGDVGGIVFTVQSQDDPDDPEVLPELAVFSFSDFTVPEGVTVIGTGDRALVILSCGEMTINGVVSVASNTEWSGFDIGTPGPGGGGGGLESMDDGDGPGGGAAGLHGPEYSHPAIL